ncbi:histidine phosphatase family protein [Paenibacillus taihuensis]
MRHGETEWNVEHRMQGHHDGDIRHYRGNCERK